MPMTATARRLAELTQEQRQALLNGFSASDLAALEFHWPFWARPDQLPPLGDWRTWLLLGGRGSGKTRSAAEWVRAEMESGRRRNMGVIGPTADAVRGVMVEGPSGLLAVAPDALRTSYEPSTRRLVYPNGGIVRTFSAEEPDRLRGPEP
jgi:phage terminase large subunit-like protein